MGDIIYREESFAIVGAAMHVHSELGMGFVEKVYQDALEIEFKKRGIPFEREKRLLVDYEGNPLRRDFYVDFLCYSKIAVEIKAASRIAQPFVAQTMSYIKAGDFKLGLLLNFGQPSLAFRRLLNSNANII